MLLVLLLQLSLMDTKLFTLIYSTPNFAYIRVV